MKDLLVTLGYEGHIEKSFKSNWRKKSHLKNVGVGFWTFVKIFMFQIFIVEGDLTIYI